MFEASSNLKHPKQSKVKASLSIHLDQYEASIFTDLLVLLTETGLPRYLTDNQLIMDQTGQQVAGAADGAENLVKLKEYFQSPKGAMTIAEHIANAVPISSENISRHTDIAIEDVDRLIDEIGRNELMKYVAKYCIDLRRFVKEETALVDEVLERMMILYRQGSSTHVAQLRAIGEYVGRKLGRTGTVAFDRARQVEVGKWLRIIFWMSLLFALMLASFLPYKYSRAARTDDMRKFWAW